MTDGLFYDECVKVAAESPDVNWKSSIVDAFNADVHLHPDRYDIVAMTNLRAQQFLGFRRWYS